MSVLYSPLVRGVGRWAQQAVESGAGTPRLLAHQTDLGEQLLIQGPLGMLTVGRCSLWDWHCCHCHHHLDFSFRGQRWKVQEGETEDSRMAMRTSWWIVEGCMSGWLIWLAQWNLILHLPSISFIPRPAPFRLKTDALPCHLLPLYLLETHLLRFFLMISP